MIRPVTKRIACWAVAAIQVSILAVATLAATPLRKIEPVAWPGFVDRIPSPDGKRCLFYRFEPGEPVRCGVARADDSVVWSRNAGLRPITDRAWSDDGRLVLFVTDCIQEDADLRSRNPSTRSWLIVLDANDGHTAAEGDLDTCVLDLPRRRPDAVGAPHEMERLWSANGQVGATVRSGEERITGSCALADVRPDR